VCALLVRSCRWSWCTPFSGHPAPCSVCYYEPLAPVLREGAQLIEKAGVCSLLPTVQVHTQTSPPELCAFFPKALVMSSVNFHNLWKRFNVGSAARHLTDRFEIPLTPEFDVSLLFLAFIISDSR